MREEEEEIEMIWTGLLIEKGEENKAAVKGL
jgi:hypothetical protein